MVIILAILVVVVVLWSYKGKTAGETRTARAYKDWRDKVKTAGWRTRFGGWSEKKSTSWRPKLGGWRRKRAKKEPQQFKEWVVEASLAENKQLYQSLPDTAQAFATWLAGLSLEETAAFDQDLSAFCSGLNFELAWLLNQELDDDPGLKQAVDEAVVLYALAHHKATQVQGNIEVFRTFMAWQEDPTKGEHKELTQALFDKLVEKGLAPAPSPKLFMASEQKRQEHIVQAIRKAAEADRQAFSAILKEVMAPADISPAKEPAPKADKQAVNATPKEAEAPADSPPAKEPAPEAQKPAPRRGRRGRKPKAEAPATT